MWYVVCGMWCGVIESTKEKFFCQDDKEQITGWLKGAMFLLRRSIIFVVIATVMRQEPPRSGTDKLIINDKWLLVIGLAK